MTFPYPPTFEKWGLPGPVVAPQRSSNDRHYQTHSDVVSVLVISIVTYSLSSHLLRYFCFILQAHSTFLHFLQIVGPQKLWAWVLQHP